MKRSKGSLNQKDLKRNLASLRQQRITQHIRCGLTPLPFGTLLPSIATSYMLDPLGNIAERFKRMIEIIKNVSMIKA